MRNIILFGGGFDPIHKGHLNIARKARDTFDADVILIPSVVSVWKSNSTPFEKRIEMLKIAIKDEKRFFISRYEETTGKQTNYSIDTVRYFKEQYKDAKLYFLIGQDHVNLFDKWNGAKEISELAQIIYSARPGYQEDSPNIQKFNMIKLDAELIDAASRDIRGMDDLDKLPEELFDYILDNKLFFMTKIKTYLSDHRYNHSISVAKLAYKIAKANKLDNPEDYLIAALLHDIAKEIPMDKAKEMMEEHYKEYLDIKPFAYHQFLGSYLAKTDFGIYKEEVLDAIRFHATGKANMSPIEMIIYASDKIEPTRGFDSTDLINSCLKDYKQGFKDVLKANQDYFKEKGIDADNRLTKACFDQYL